MAGFDFMFNMMDSVFPIMFFLIFGIVIFGIFKGIRQWSQNNHSPVLSVAAQVVNMREDVSSHHNMAGENHMHHHTSTTYYVTFQVESGDRLEFAVSGKMYGMLALGDTGKLTFQGTRFLDFQRP